MYKLLFKFSALALTSLILSLSANMAFAARPAPTTPTLLGNDISWPQCSKTLPKGQAFGIVGLNNGLANNTNPCFATELAWAQNSKGGTGQDKAALYVNTANPGLSSTSWPTSNDYGGNTVNNPYGACNHGDDAACAYMYGYAKAYDDYNGRGVSNPSSYLWWLDVETTNSWETNTGANAADLEGMTAYFLSQNVKGVGLYSTSYQWGQIAGVVGSGSNLNNLRSWIPGANSQSSAKTNCNVAPLTAGSKVTLAQFVSSNLDYDYSCI